MSLIDDPKWCNEDRLTDDPRFTSVGEKIGRAAMAAA